MKSLIRFFYVWANWGTISDDLEAYRRQIKGREEWAKTALQQKDALHEMAQEQLRREVDEWKTTAEGTLKVAREAVETTKDLQAKLEKSKQLADDIGEACADSVLLLARLLQREGPLTRVLLLNSLDEIPRKLVERMLAALPPPPSPPPLNLGDLMPPPSVGGMDLKPTFSF